LGTPSSGTLTNCTGLPNAGLVNSSVTVGSTSIALGATSTTLAGLTGVTSSVITDSGLTSGRVTYASTGGLLADSANLTFNGTTLTTANDASISGLTVGKGGGAIGTNTVLGVSALTGNSAGTQNTVVGYQAGYATTGGASTIVGYQAAFSANTQTILAVGTQALYSSTTGNANTAVGDYQTMYSNTTGATNVAVGRQALYSNTTGSNNTAVGYQALYANTNSQNTAVGYQAGNALTSGNTNTMIGYQAGVNTTTGAYNVLVGDILSTSAVGDNFSILIGHNGTGKGSNTFFITPNGGSYQGNNSLSWSVTSDQRLKKNIVDNTEGLDIISQIRVRNFEYRTKQEVTDLPTHTVIDKQGVQLGVIAQELQEVCSDCVKEETTGVLSVDASNLTWHMINAIKDLKALVDAQATEITALKAKVGI
jgi:hypothetical protein